MRKSLTALLFVLSLSAPAAAQRIPSGRAATAVRPRVAFHGAVTLTLLRRAPAPQSARGLLGRGVRRVGDATRRVVWRGLATPRLNRAANGLDEHARQLERFGTVSARLGVQTPEQAHANAGEIAGARRDAAYLRSLSRTSGAGVRLTIQQTDGVVHHVEVEHANGDRRAVHVPGW